MDKIFRYMKNVLPLPLWNFYNVKWPFSQYKVLFTKGTARPTHQEYALLLVVSGLFLGSSAYFLSGCLKEKKEKVIMEIFSRYSRKPKEEYKMFLVTSSSPH